VDNIPGVPGVGEKTAVELLRAFNSLDNLLAHASEIAKPRLREAINSHADQIRVNRTLVVLCTDLAIPIPFDGLKLQPYDRSALNAIFRQLGFKSLAAELEKQTQDSHDLFAPR
jgi:DNA polymerase-1